MCTELPESFHAPSFISCAQAGVLGQTKNRTLPYGPRAPRGLRARETRGAAGDAPPRAAGKAAHDELKRAAPAHSEDDVRGKRGDIDARVDAATAEIARLLDGKRRDLLGDAA